MSKENRKENKDDNIKNSAKEENKKLGEEKTNKLAKKKRFPINLFDIAVIVFVFLVLIFFSLKLKDRNSSGVAKKLYFTIQALNLEKDFKDKISIGDQIRDNVKGYFYGSVSDFKSKPARKITEDITKGEYVYTKIPDRIDLEVTVKCDAKVSDDLITVDNNPVRLGKLMSLKSKGYVVYGYIIDMKVE